MAQTKKRGLGRGLDALLSAEETYTSHVEPVERLDSPLEGEVAPHPSVNVEQGPSEGRLTHVPTAQLRPGVHQPRVGFDDGELAELSESVRLHGILQPILVRASGEGYEIVAGERRWRAAQLAGLSEVPVILIDAAGERSLEIAVIENIQRSDLNPMEEAAAYESMMERLGLTQEEVAARVGKNRSTVANYVRLLRLPEAVQESVASGGLTMGHARALLALRTEEEMIPLVEATERYGLSVRQLEARVRKSLSKPTPRERRQQSLSSPTGPTGPQAVFLRQIEEKLRAKLSAKVTIQGDERKGQLIIEYYSAQMLEGIVDKLS